PLPEEQPRGFCRAGVAPSRGSRDRPDRRRGPGDGRWGVDICGVIAGAGRAGPGARGNGWERPPGGQVEELTLRSLSVNTEEIREIVLAALERRRRTRSQLETILRRKGVKPGDFSVVLDRLTEVGLIDDLQYARVYLERRAASRPRGARLLRAELLAKGVPSDLADQALAERREESDP